MKRKLFILGTLGLAGLFAGGVVAAYTITDNAGKQGIKITPGTITDDETGNVTLSWGDMTKFKNISGLSSSAPVTKSVTVKAAFEGEEESENKSVYLGKLDVELKDLSGKATNENRLIDHLHIVINGYKYENEAFANEMTKLGEIPTEGEGAFATSIGVYADANGKQVDFVVSLDAVDATVMSQIVTDQVYLSVDWNRGGSETDGTKRVYIPKNTEWGSDLYVYSYSNNGSVQNAAFPGVKCTVDAETGLFVADLLPHEYFVFSDGTNQYPATGGMSAASLAYDTATAIYFDWSTHTFTSTAPVQLADFYLLGEVNEWTASSNWDFEAANSQLPEGVDEQWKIEFSAVTGKRYKVRSGDGSLWLGYDWIEEDARALVNKTNDDGDFDFKVAGNYEIYLKHWTGSGYSMWIAQKA